MNNVLIIDDDVIVTQKNYHFISQHPDFQCCGIASSMKKAKEMIFESDIHIDLILLDIYMQQGNGIDLLPLMLKIGYRIDVIVISAVTDAIMINDSLRYGVTDYLIKPFQTCRLEVALTGWLQKKMVMHKYRHYDQFELDLLIHGKVPKIWGDGCSLPKGITPQTLHILCRWISENKEVEFSTDELSNAVNLSRVTCRKYLLWLVDCDVLYSGINYGISGRPVYTYHAQPAHFHLLKKYSQ
ncbi:two-component system response regulator DcuR [Citrobacter amalonaticus]|uniref:two-component system response regulator DcuR n=1 Tax=Citrobacter amalonaticus TaxID=35703 RepID=UPI00292A895E|nr:two-component system response regulator DcuR [Citrobacter amalonaticus]MDV0784743.1 two-component system response regulator DcuR [Citrobacter amalonaticus]MEB0640806.1 two-component system response regulator DcuR [Citrobacter amalonaticus]